LWGVLSRYQSQRRLLAGEHDVLLKPVSLLFTGKHSFFSLKSAPNAFSILCPGFVTAGGLDPLKQRFETADLVPRQVHFFFYLWLLLRLESQMVRADDGLPTS
jgi:hypothetical protein